MRTIAEIRADSAKDREVAGKATPGTYTVEHPGKYCAQITAWLPDECVEVATTEESKGKAPNAAHIARNDPARVQQRADDIEAMAEEIGRLQNLLHPWYGPCDGFADDGGCSVCADLADFKREKWDVEGSALRIMREQRDRFADQVTFIQGGGIAKERDEFKALCERLAGALRRRDGHAHAVLQRKPVRDFDEGAEEARILFAEYERLAK